MKSPWDYAASGTEYAEQVALFQWSNMAARFGLRAADDPQSYKVRGHALTRLGEGAFDGVPQLRLLFAIKNAGHGDAVRGARSAAEGVKPGVPDTMLPVPILHEGARERCSGLFIELKRVVKVQRKAGTVSDKQEQWQVDLQEQGYCVQVCYGWLAAREVLLNYLGR